MMNLFLLLPLSLLIIIGTSPEEKGLYYVIKLMNL
jgi:hypothetical protein